MATGLREAWVVEDSQGKPLGVALDKGRLVYTSDDRVVRYVPDDKLARVHHEAECYQAGWVAAMARANSEIPPPSLCTCPKSGPNAPTWGKGRAINVGHGPGCPWFAAYSDQRRAEVDAHVAAGGALNWAGEPVVTCSHVWEPYACDLRRCRLCFCTEPEPVVTYRCKHVKLGDGGIVDGCGWQGPHAAKCPSCGSTHLRVVDAHDAPPRDRLDYAIEALNEAARCTDGPTEQTRCVMHLRIALRQVIQHLRKEPP